MFSFPYNSDNIMFRNLTGEYQILNKKRRAAMCLTYLGYASSRYDIKNVLQTKKGKFTFQ